MSIDGEGRCLIEVEIPPRPEPGFIDGWAQFEFGSELLRRYSLPIVMLDTPGPAPVIGKDGVGERVRTTPEGGSFRVFFPPHSNRIKLQIFFPGPLNPRPRQLKLPRLTVKYRSRRQEGQPALTA